MRSNIHLKNVFLKRKKEGKKTKKNLVRYEKTNWKNP